MREGGTLDFSKRRDKKRLTPSDIIGVNFTDFEKLEFPELSILSHVAGISQPLTIAVDWFEVHLSLNKIKLSEIPLVMHEGEKIFQWTENVILNLSPLGSKIMSRTWEVILMYQSEQIKIGWLTTHPRKLTGEMKETSGFFKMSNELLYQSDWLNMFSEFFLEIDSEIKNVTRLDIALDGVNDLVTWLNFYTKQVGEGKKYGLMGKAQFHCGVQDHKTMLYGSFRLGTSKSDKVLVVYNKTSEIEQSSGKKYILNFWLQNGLVAANPEKITSERFKNFNPDFGGQTPVVYRCELRLTSKAVGTIKDFDITRLTEPEYLSSIFVTQVESTMRFALLTDQYNISRCKQFFPIDFSSLSGELLDKTKKSVKDHRMKAKMGIHKSCMDIFTGKAIGTDGEANLDYIDFNLGEKELSDWFCRSIERYEREYYPFFPKDKDRTTVEHLLKISSRFRNQAKVHKESREEKEEETQEQWFKDEDWRLNRVLDEMVIEAKKKNNVQPLPDSECPF